MPIKIFYCTNTVVNKFSSSTYIPANMLKNFFFPGYVELEVMVLVRICQMESFQLTVGLLLLRQTIQLGGHLLVSGK